MYRIVYLKENFNIFDTLNCGQVFRFKRFKNGFLVFSNNKCCYVYEQSENTVIECENCDKNYFINFFDLERDYKKIVQRALLYNNKLRDSAITGKGIRLLNQDIVESLFSFIISQNNNIPRIKKILDNLCLSLGEQKEFLDQKYFTFPTVESMAKMPLSFYENIGLGYRAKYIQTLAIRINEGLDVLSYKYLTTSELRKKLMLIKGVGPKVADCVILFGYKHSDTFPVDTWIEKVYLEDFKGEKKNRKKISEYFVNLFGEDSGYFQQYLFYSKRGI